MKLKLILTTAIMAAGLGGLVADQAVAQGNVFTYTVPSHAIVVLTLEAR